MFHVRSIRKRQASAVVAIVTAVSLLAAQTASAVSVRVFVLAPEPPNSLSWVEEQGASKPWFQRNFVIPYDVIEPLIRSEIKTAADRTVSGTVVCTDPCPDVDWRVVVTTDFAFTHQG
jgi:hypothetical protein